MPASRTQVVYKPDSMSTNEYIVILADAGLYKKWLDGDKTIPLVEIVDSFDVFHTGQGAQGILERPSNQELETVFGGEDSKKLADVEIVTIILEKGRLNSASVGDKSASKNDNRGGANTTSKGSMGGAGGR